MTEYEKLADLVWYISRDADFLNSDVVTDEMDEAQLTALYYDLKNIASSLKDAENIIANLLRK